MPTRRPAAPVISPPSPGDGDAPAELSVLAVLRERRASPNPMQVGSVLGHLDVPRCDVVVWLERPSRGPQPYRHLSVRCAAVRRELRF